MRTESKTIGILGGMGPEATLELYRKILQFTEVHCDQDHHRILIDNNPFIPDRTAFILGLGPDPLPALTDSALLLERAGADLIIMPCNTAHFWLDDLAARVNIPFLDMIGETADCVFSSEPEVNKVTVLSTSGTMKAGLYHRRLEEGGVTCLEPTPGEQEIVMEAIYKVKAGDYSTKDKLVDLCRNMTDCGTEGFILGCTELPLLIDAKDLDRPVFDPLTILARRAVERAAGTISIVVQTNDNGV